LRCVLVTKGYTHRENHPFLGVVIIVSGKQLIDDKGKFQNIKGDN